MDYLINKYINKHYFLSLTSGFRISDRFDDNKKFELTDLVYHINQIFGTANKISYPICVKWYQINKSNLLSDLNLYLTKCKIVLNQFGWRISNGGDIFSLDGFISLIEPDLEGEEIIRDWFDNEQAKYLAKNHNFY